MVKIKMIAYDWRTRDKNEINEAQRERRDPEDKQIIKRRVKFIPV